jgi:hypothetical protein
VAVELDIWTVNPGDDEDEQFEANDPHNLKNAERMLKLLLPERADQILHDLVRAPIQWYLADDVLRAARMEPLDDNDPEDHEVLMDHMMMLLGKQKRHPAMLVQLAGRAALAAGDHHVRFAYWLHPETLVPCRTVFA